jgi:hypothetical protein
VQETKIEVILSGGAMQVSDSVKYVVAGRDTFYYQMVKRQELRAAVASDLIYGSGDPSDPSKFGLQLNGFNSPFAQDQHLVNLVSGLANYIRGKVNDATRPDGFHAGVYFDYCSRKCLVAFRGTDRYSPDDWETNLTQYIYGRSSQYDKAMEIGMWIYPRGVIDDVVFTGHSLGGGLASAATFFAIPHGYNRRTTYTFNAAHFRLETGKDFMVRRSLIMDHEIRFDNNFSNAQINIVAYRVDGEVLHHIQREFLNAPANGLGRELPRNYRLTLEAIETLDPIALLWNPTNRVRLHLMHHVFVGLEIFRGIRPWPN